GNHATAHPAQTHVVAFVEQVGRISFPGVRKPSHLQLVMAPSVVGVGHQHPAWIRGQVPGGRQHKTGTNEQEQTTGREEPSPDALPHCAFLPSTTALLKDRPFPDTQSQSTRAPCATTALLLQSHLHLLKN